MSQQPLYRIVYADGSQAAGRTWRTMLSFLRLVLDSGHEVVRVERVSPAPRATGGQR
jgi:hypothetical protein